MTSNYLCCAKWCILIFTTTLYGCRTLPTHQQVIHGGVDKAMRKESMQLLCAHPFDGVAIGGSIGKTREEMVDLLDYVMHMVPRDKVRVVGGRSVSLSISPLQSSDIIEN